MPFRAKKNRHSDQKTKNSIMEEESPKKNDGTATLRRSLRHSPGNSSLSPPRKARRLKEPLSTTDEIKDNSTSKSPKVEKLLAKTSATPEKNSSRRSTRNSGLKMAQSPSRTTRNTSQVHTSPAKISKTKDTPEKKAGSPTTSSKNVKKNLNITPDKSDENHDINEAKTPPRSRRKTSASNNQSITNIGDSPVRSTRKRNLILSPNSPKQEETNGASPKHECNSKRRCHGKPPHFIQNGKPVNLESTDNDSNSVSKDQLPNSVSNDLLPIPTPLNTTTCKSSAEDDHHSQSNKRKLHSNEKSPDENTDSNINKRCKLIVHGPSSSLSSLDNSSVKQKTELPNSASKSSDDSFKGLKKEKTTCEDNAHQLLGSFGLIEAQKVEILSLLSQDIIEKSSIFIVKELVHILLQDGLSLSSMSSPRFNKLLRQLIIKYCSLESSIEKKHQISETALAWAKERKVVNLQHELELALMTLYYDTGFYRKAEETANGLYKETKKLQDKEKTVKACLCLSKVYHAMGNIAKARANITTAKTEALKIYTPPDLQAELDLQSGIMQVAEEKDMETAFSYFKEAATAFTERSLRARALKYMLLAKLLVNKPEEGQKAVNSQLHVEDIDEGVEALLHVTKDAISCSLSSFIKTYKTYKKELDEDFVVKQVIDDLYVKMLEKNLLNIIAPYERMEISFIAEKIGLDRVEVERRLSQMILDGQISAQLDHRDDCLYVYQHETRDSVYPNAVQTISQLDRTLSLLSRRIKQLL